MISDKILMITLLVFFGSCIADQRDEWREFCQAGKKTTLSEKCSAFCKLERSTCEREIAHMGSVLQYICKEEEYKKWRNMLSEHWALCLKDRAETIPTETKASPAVIVRQKMYDLINQKRLSFKEPLSINDLAVLEQFIKDLENEGISVSALSGIQGKKEEL
jgi:hypothetical protein